MPRLHQALCSVQTFTVCYFSSVCNALSNRSVVFTRTKYNSEFNYNIIYLYIYRYLNLINTFRSKIFEYITLVNGVCEVLKSIY